jgi:hypothetical protein
MDITLFAFAYLTLRPIQWLGAIYICDCHVQKDRTYQLMMSLHQDDRVAHLGLPKVGKPTVPPGFLSLLQLISAMCFLLVHCRCSFSKEGWWMRCFASMTSTYHFTVDGLWISAKCFSISIVDVIHNIFLCCFKLMSCAMPQIFICPQRSVKPAMIEKLATYK